MASGTSASIRGKNSETTELRIVLIGGRRGDEPSGKSSVGNIILGRDVFETNRRTVKSVMRQEVVSGRQVTVVDTPGWWSPHPLDLTPKLTQLEIQQSVYLCPPGGPHAFVLVMPLDKPYVGTDMSVEEHLSLLLSDRVWKHTIVVFTVADKNKMRPDLIRSDPNLRYITEKCEGRFHVLNITDRVDRSQVTELMEKIDQMVTSNGCHYETEKHVSEELKEMERTISRRAEQRRADAQKQTTGLPKDTGLTDLRIVLLGRSCSGKSSAGNTILGGSGFKVSQYDQRSVQCEVRHGEVSGRHVTVVDSPGWYYNSPLQDTSEMDKLEIQNSVSLCPPGPHAVLVTVPLHRAFTKTNRVALEEHMTLLSQSVWSHAIVLFNHGDCLGDRSIEQHIEAEGEDLRWLVDKCGNRYHVFNNQKTDDTQVTELLGKIEEMVTGNRGGHYEDDGDVSETLSERKKITEEHVQTFLTKTQRQRTALKALFEGEHQSLPDVKVMLVGGEQEHRSRAGDHILQQTVFKRTPFKEFKTQTKLTECVREQRRVARRKVSVVNCPDWSTTPPSRKIKDVLLHGVTLCSPELHAVLLTVDVRSSFSEADRRSVEEHMELLGDRVWRHTLVLFTHGWWLGERRVEEYIESEGEPLRWILEKCGYKYHVLNSLKWDILEVTELMVKIEDMVYRNRGHFGQMPLFERLKGITEEQWKKREQEMIERMLKSVVTEPEEPTLPAVRRRNNMDLEDAQSKDYPPDMSGGTRSSGYDTMSEAPTQADADSVVKEPVESSQPAVRRRNSKQFHPPSMSGGTRSSGYDTMSEASTQTDADSVVKEPVESTLPAVRRRNSMSWLPPSMSGGTRSSGFDTMSEVSSLADTDETRPMTLFERLTGRRTLTPEEWKKREEEVIERMLKFVMMAPQEPSMSETYCWSPAKVSDWLTTHFGPIAPSSGYDTMSIAPSQADTDVMRVRDEDVS